MCFQLLERFTACKCLYYSHAVDRCQSYGRKGHIVTRREIIVGYACLDHTEHQGPGGFRQYIDRSGPKLPKYTSETNILSDDAASTKAELFSVDQDGRAGEGVTPSLEQNDELATKNNSNQESADNKHVVDLDGTGASDSEGSEMSETETAVSVVTSTTLVDSDAVEIVFRRLMLFEDLR